MGGDDDATLMQRHVDGDPDAFGELVRRHRDRLWAVAVRTLGNPDDAADALQDAFVNAFRRAATFRAESAVTTWLHRIVVNACLDQVRRTAARPVVALTEDADVSSPGPDPGTQTALRLDVEAALATLPTEQRVPLVLVDMEGYPVNEVAEMLGCPVGTVKSRCARARARLLPLLTSHGSEESERGNPVPPLDVPSTSASGPGGEHI
ncbi:MAG TPA: RNA polymerase sigma factor SigM [Jiangellaceae bacterium]|nr:RNA polymerase sigma factor SigM [Jiangellaceae bacterium]